MTKKLAKTTKTPTLHFPAVRKAREALRERAHELLERYLSAIAMAEVAGEYESALKAYQWLLDHIPAEDGQRIFEASIDKHQIEDSGSHGPQIQIGIKLGGVNTPQQLVEAQVIDTNE